MIEALGCRLDQSGLPRSDTLCLLVPFGDDAVSASIRFGADPARTVCLDALLDLGDHRTLMMTPVTRQDMRDAAHASMASDGVGVTVIRDSMGFVEQRVLATVVNLAYDIAQHEIASPKDIDNAVRLGLNYPHGPLEWGDAMGLKRLLGILERMSDLTRDPRYRPSAWLRRRAMLGVSLLHHELSIR